MNAIMNNIMVQLYYALSEIRPHEFSVYYRVYDNDGEIASKTSFDKNNPSLGHVNTFCAPPHTVSSLKNHIIKSEDVSGHAAQLFEEDSESAMNDSDALDLLSDMFPSSLLFKDTPEISTHLSWKSSTSPLTSSL